MNSFVADRERLVALVQTLSGLRHGWGNPKMLTVSARQIEMLLTDYGFQVNRQTVPYQMNEYHNIVATLVGTDPSLPMLLLGAHYDGPFGSPGADDNASGVATLLEVARLFSGMKPRRTIKFVAFTLEEVQQAEGTYLIGSTYYAKAAKQSGEKYDAVLILESVGFTGEAQMLPPMVRIKGAEKGDFLAVVGDHRSRHIAATFTRTAIGYVPELKVVPYCAPPLIGHRIPELRFSDHAPFWDQGFPAVMLTDTAMMRNPNYHASTDTPETLDYEFLTNVTIAVFEVLREWSNK